MKESCTGGMFMKKKLIIISLILLSNCSTPGTALLGPIFTGAKTGSITQASLSYSSNKIFEEIKSNENITNFLITDKKEINKNPTFPDIPFIVNDPVILLSYKVNIIEISEVNEPEPLP